MKRFSLLTLAGVTLLWVVAPALAGAQTQDQPKPKLPEPGVPQIMSIEGNFVRAAYNGEGYAILGYKLANLSVGEPWMLLEVGFALRDGIPDYDLTRDALSLDTPDGQTVPLPSVAEYREADLRALKNREKVQRDSINYFPPNAYRACSLQFFTDLENRAMPWDKVELDDSRACLGRLYFPVPGGIKHGQYWLNVKFANSVIRVPFRILTKDEENYLNKNYKSIKKQVDEAFKKKATE